MKKQDLGTCMDFIKQQTTAIVELQKSVYQLKCPHEHLTITLYEDGIIGMFPHCKDCNKEITIPWDEATRYMKIGKKLYKKIKENVK
jgi:hypothetical protein